MITRRSVQFKLPWAKRRGFRGTVFVSAALVLTFAVASTIATSYVVAGSIRRNAEADLQARATSLARIIDLKLKTYMSALETMAQSYSLIEEFDVSILEREARRVGDQFGGWFVLTRDGDVMDILMSTASEDGSLPPAEPRTSYPEVTRAEEQSIRIGDVVVSDAFRGRIRDELVVTLVKALEPVVEQIRFIYFSVTLEDITAWLMDADLNHGEFAAIADGSRRIIARSEQNTDLLLADLPEWFVAFSEGRDNGVAEGEPAFDGATRLFAIQRLELAPQWTLAVSSPVPIPFAAIYKSPLPAFSGIATLLIGLAFVRLYLGRTRAQAVALRAKDEIASREVLLAEVRAADARKARLMAVLAHDLRTPLVAILGTLDLFRKATNDPTHARMLHRLKTDGHGMLHLIDDVLELARLGAGEALLRPEPFAPAELLTQLGDIVRPSAELHETQVVVEVDDLPTLHGDVMSLRRVLLNFATNAVKATRGGEVRLSAKVDAAGADGHTITWTVTDTGRGIAPEDIPRLFRDFGMLERDGPTGDGNGLGLAICRRLATAMGGEVGCESTPGVGSRFWLRVTLPEVQDALHAGDASKDNPAAALAGLRVLVAEDHDVIRQVTCAVLERVGMLPTEAADGMIAVELAEATEFDLILMDLQMPRLDGDEAAARIRRGNGPSAKALMIGVTAHQPPEIAIMLSDLALDACLRKPLDLEQLAGLIQGNRPIPTGANLIEGFDQEALVHLREIDGGLLLARTLKAFAVEIETTRIEMQKLIANSDTYGAGRLVHKLVGVCDILGARSLSIALREFEQLIHDDDGEALTEGLERIDGIMAKTSVQVSLMAEDPRWRPGGRSSGYDQPHLISTANT